MWINEPPTWDRTNSPHAAVVDVGVGRGSPAGSVSDGESRPITVLGSNPQSFLPSSRQQLHAGKMVAEGDLASARQRHENKQNPEEDALAPGEEDVMEKSDTPMISLLKNGTVNATRSSLDWEGAGGEYGLSAEWREAISIRDGEGEGGGGGINTSLRGEACMAEESQAGVQEILERRRTIPPTKKVGVRSRKRWRELSSKHGSVNNRSSWPAPHLSLRYLPTPAPAVSVLGVGVALASKRKPGGAGAPHFTFSNRVCL